MQPTKKIIFSEDARKNVLEGINQIANAVKVTLGPRGKTVLIEKETGHPHLTKDGVTVARHIRIKDPAVNAGVQLIRNVASNTCDKAGDGTTTATVLAQKIASEGLKLISAGINCSEIKKGMEMALDIVDKDLDDHTVAIENKDDLFKVAYIASNGDDEVAERLSYAFTLVGKQGVITIEDGAGAGIDLELMEGIQFDKGYISPLFLNNVEKGTCEFTNPWVMIYEKPLSTLHPMINLLNDIIKTTRPLLILSSGVDGEALSLLVMNKIQANVAVAAVAYPYDGERKKVFMEDVAIFTGGQIMNQDLGKKMESLGMSLLGGADKVIISESKTIIIGGHASQDPAKKTKLYSRIKLIRDQLLDPDFDGDKKFLEHRLGNLTQGIAVIKVGAATDIEQKERKDRVEDAFYATKGAYESGVVPGGGVSLLRASKRIDERLADLPGTSDFAMGMRIVAKSLLEPTRQIIANIGAGHEISTIIDRILHNDNYSWGFDAKNEVECDMMECGIVDPTKVVKTALRDAISAAATVLSLEAVIVREEEKKAPGESYGF